jgi:ABC-type antimicrobial peptide transport system permease subunit
MQDSGEEDKVISYIDVTGVMIKSVKNITNAVSYVLIAFVAISLVVSSVMIGVITYISVLERHKEIGILRAIGASKRNISQVFNAETFIIGALAGLLGVGITYLLLIPANHIIARLAKGVEIRAFLPLTSAGILVLISIVLTMIGGLIPAKKAARSDPVAALRSE